MAIPDKAITRNEQYLAAMAGQSGTLPDAPITRKERYLAKAAGQAVETPEPITREEMYLDVIAEGGGGGGGVTVTPLSIAENGTYTAPSGTAYSPVTVNVPGVPNAQYLEFTPVTTATDSNPLTINLTPVTSGNKYWLVCWIKDLPAPSATEMIAVYCQFEGFSTSTSKNGLLMRTDGTIGTDQRQFSFVSSTGVLTVGGSYGYFPAGQTYCVLLVEVP